MSSSRVIKSARQGGGHNILVSRPAGERPATGDFHALESLWQSDDRELAAALGELETAHERLRQERERTKAECEALVAAAQARTGEIEKSAFEAGFSAGKAEAETEGRRRLSEFAAQLDTLLAGIEQDRQRLHDRYEADILTLVKAMVDRALFHEARVNPQAIEVCLKTALAYVVENSSVTARLHGEDLARLKQVAMERPGLLSGHRRIELIEDPMISPGGCLLETAFGEIDATLESRRDKVFAAIDAVLRQAAQLSP